jgi:hypothetical protein
MNYLAKKNLLKFKISSSFYSLVLKTKFRRDTQPGLTRYGYDELDKQSGNMDVSNFHY